MPLSDNDLSLFRDTLAGYLRDAYGDVERRRIYDTDEGWSVAHWRAFAHDLGLLGVGFPSSLGGLDGGAAEHAMVMEQFGGALVAEPYLCTAVIGGGFLKRGTLPRAAELIGALIAGDMRIAYAHGEPGTRYNLAHVETSARKTADGYALEGSKAVVLGGASATHFVVIARTGGGPRDPGGISAFLVEADRLGIERRDYRTLSGAPASELQLRGVAVPEAALLAPAGDALPLVERVVDEATAVICAEAVGVMGRLHGDTLAYTQQRRQFGRPLASFQALQHRMVDMLMLSTHAASLVPRAIAALDGDADERARIVSATKVYVGKAARFCGQQAIQLHGGMGMTDELAVGFFFKRAIEIERQFGTIDHHLTRYERTAFDRRRAA